MLETFPFAVTIGTALGFLSGLGTGGGSLLILWLTLVLNMPPEQARLINLMFFLPSALIACLFRWKQGQLEIEKILPAIIAGSIVSGTVTFFTQNIDTALLRRLFGGLLLLTGIKELLYKPKKQ